MKKLFPVLLLLICTLLSLTGCVIIEQDFPELPEMLMSSNEEWTNITFKTLTGKENLTISRNFQDMNSLIISTPDYDKDFLVVAVLKTDCEKSKAMAPYLNELATRIIPEFHGMNYVPVFLDVHEDSTNKNVPWMNKLSNVDLFMNAATICSDNACQDVFLPLLPEPVSGSIYVVNTHDIKKTQKVYSWNLTDDPNTQFQIMEREIAKALGLEEVTWDPNVDDWENCNSNHSN